MIVLRIREQRQDECSHHEKCDRAPARTLNLSQTYAPPMWVNNIKFSRLTSSVDVVNRCVQQKL